MRQRIWDHLRLFIAISENEDEGSRNRYGGVSDSRLSQPTARETGPAMFARLRDAVSTAPVKIAVRQTPCGSTLRGAESDVHTDGVEVAMLMMLS